MLINTEIQDMSPEVEIVKEKEIMIIFFDETRIELSFYEWDSILEQVKILQARMKEKK